MILTIIIISWLLVGFGVGVMWSYCDNEKVSMHMAVLYSLLGIFTMFSMAFYMAMGETKVKSIILFDFTKKEDKLRDIRFKGDTK